MVRVVVVRGVVVVRRGCCLAAVVVSCAAEQFAETAPQPHRSRSPPGAVGPHAARRSPFDRKSTSVDECGCDLRALATETQLAGKGETTGWV